MSPLWTPSPERVAGTRWRAFADRIAELHGIDVPDGEALHRWSVEQPAAFWRAAWDFTGMVGDPGERTIVAGADLPGTRFFPDARLNVARTLLRHDDDRLAMRWRTEGDLAADLSWADLHALVSRLQQALQSAGVGEGDHVAAWLPNRPETYALMIATASIGAVFTSTSPDFGTGGVVDRFGQVDPVVLVASDGYRYGGKWFDCLDRLDAVRSQLPSLHTTVVVPYDGDVRGDPPAGTVPWDDFCGAHQAAPVTYVDLPFDHPWYVLFSSGTTGKPKCIVHRTGGVLLKHLVEHQLHSDVHDGDRVFYFTTAGWMMWNWLASGLGSGATLGLYDGSPFHPDGNRLFDLADELDLTLLGVSAKFIDACNKAGLRPRETHELGSLRTICSTGSTLVPEGFDYVYDHVKADVHLQSMSGGTDLCGCLVAGDPTGAVHRGEIQLAGLGMAIEVLDHGGSPLPPGEQGELVCSSAFPSMPLGFRDDDDGARYRRTYFERFPGRWHQGDFAEWGPGGGMIIHGRSDATLNPGGVRIGTAEIYRQVDAIDDVVESLVIGQQWDDDTRVVLFVVLQPGVELDDDLVQAIRSRVRTGASPRHVPAKVVAVADLPRTRSGKLTELAVRDLVHGRPVLNAEALANPESLDLFRNLPELST